MSAVSSNPLSASAIIPTTSPRKALDTRAPYHGRRWNRVAQCGLFWTIRLQSRLCYTPRADETRHTGRVARGALLRARTLFLLPPRESTEGRVVDSIFANRYRPQATVFYIFLLKWWVQLRHFTFFHKKQFFKPILK